MSEPHDPNVTDDIPPSPDSLDAGLAAGFGRPPEVPRSSLDASRRPVLLREAQGESDHVVRPHSDAMPDRSQAGDRYQLFGEIARGGMGAVLRGRDVDLGRDLAVKVLLEKHVNRPEVAQRFIEEAQIGGQLQHPNVVPVYDIGRFGGRPYFTMKLVKGKTLAALLAERSDPAQDRPRFLGDFLKVTQAIAYAHAKGVIHRDLKPANIMVGAFGEVQVMDWGLAKVLAEGGVADEEKAGRLRQPDEGTMIRTARSGGTAGGSGTDTEAGALLGTPAYMPPEQANGDIANLDRRADVFGLGAILCEILTGKPPYVGRSAEEVRRKAANGDLADALTRLDACGTDAELIALTRACLSAEAIDRPKDAQAVADGLTAYLDGVQERLHQAELAEAEARARAAEEAKRRRLALALAGTVLLAVTLGGGGGLYVKSDRDARQRQLARDVNDALNKATALREQSKAARAGGAALFAQAREQAQRALALVESGPADEALKEQVRHLQAELDEEEKDRKLIAALDEARLAQAETLSENRFAPERAIPLFRKAFQSYGLPAGQGEPAAVASRIGQRPAAVQEAVIAAWEEWIDLATTPSYQITEPNLDWLRAVVAATEPADSWSREFRAALAEKDAAKRRRSLEKLAAEVDVSKQTPPTLMRLARRLGNFGSTRAGRRRNVIGPVVLQLLRRAQQQYPADFWINHQLGYGLLHDRSSPAALDEAVRYLTAAVALRPDSPGANLNLGLALADKGQVDEAIACYRKAIELDPKYAAAHDNLGGALAAKGQVDEAITHFRKATDLAPKNANTYSNLGAARLAKGQLDEADACFRKALELNPKLAEPHTGLGLVRRARGQPDEAIDCYKKAIALDPKNARAHHNLAVTLAEKGQVDEAITYYRKTVECDPMDANAHYNLGLALHGKKQVDEAIDCWRKAIDLNPKFILAHNNLGNALQDKGRVDEAIICFRKAIALDLKHVLAHFNLGNALTRKGQVDEAIASYKKAIALDPKYAAAHYNLGHALAGKGQVDEAIASYKKAIALDPKNSIAHNNLGLARLSKGQLDEAIYCFKKAIDLDPKYVDAHFNLGFALDRKGEVDRAIDCFRKAIELDPKHVESHFNLGNSLSRKEQLDDAIDCWRKAIALDPKHAMAHYNLGNALSRKGKVDEAIASYKKATELAPTFVDAHFNLGGALAGKGQLDEAIDCYKKAIELNPKDGEFHCGLGHALRRQGRFAESLAALKRGHELGTKQRGWAYPSAEWVRQAERMAALEAKIPAFLKGEFRPKDTTERLALAGVCRAKKFYHATTRLYAEAFATDPKVVEDRMMVGHRYNAACYAALAAAGKGEDASKLDRPERLALRRQALTWLRGELGLWTRRVASGDIGRSRLARVLTHWQKDPDLIGIRELAALDKLPAEERAACQKLWADVAALLK